MIVISPSLVLSPLPGYTANNPVVGWHNIVSIGNLSADTEDADYPASNLANCSTASIWKGEDTSEQYLTVLTGFVDEIDYLAVARHNFGTGAIAVSVEGRASSGDSFSELVGEVIPADDAPILFRFEPQSLYEIRLRMQSGDAIPQAAVLYVGKLLVLQRRIYVGHTPIPFGRDTRVTDGVSETGEYLGRIVLGESNQTAVDIQNMTPAWYRTYMRPFIDASREAPFFFAWRPGDYPDEVGYAWMTNSPKPVNQRNNGMMQIGLQMGGIAL